MPTSQSPDRDPRPARDVRGGRGPHPDRGASRPGRLERIERDGARGVLRDETGAGAAQVSAARTRTMDASSVREFSSRDYQAPDAGAGSVPAGQTTRASAADVRGLGRATGTSSLRRGHLSQSQEGRARAAQVERRRLVPLVVVMALVAVAIGVGAFFLFRAALTSVNEGAASRSSAAYATDAFVLTAVHGDDGALAGAYLAYVDSINGRTELCWLSADVAATMPSGQDAGTLADVYASSGLSQLALVVKSMASIDLAASFEVTQAQMDAIIDVATNAGSSVDVGALAQEIAAGEGQGVSASALRGLLVTMRDVGSEGFVEMTAPADEESTDGGARRELRTDEWQTMVRGMRDAASDVSQSY